MLFGPNREYALADYLSAVKGVRLKKSPDGVQTR